MRSFLITPGSVAALCIVASSGVAQTRTDLAPVTGARAERLDSIAETFRREQGLPGITFAIVTSRGRALYQGGVGLADIAARRPVTNRTSFPIYSVSKVYTSAAAHRLASDGKLDLSSAIGRYLGDLPPWRDTMTIRQLLAHTAGLFEYTDIEGYEASASAGRSEDDHFVAMSVQRPLRFPPGARWEYSNTGYALAQSVIEIVTKDSLSHTLKTQLFEPLGLHETSPECPPQDIATGYTAAWRLGLPGDSLVASAARNSHRYILAAGGLCSTAPDIAQFVAALVAGRVVTADALDDMTRREPAVAPSGAGLFLTEDSEGLIYAHSGGGGNGNSEVMAFVRDSLVLAALTNTGGANLDRLLRVLRREVLGLPQPVVEDLPTSRDEWFPFIGSYFEPDTRNRVAVLVDQGGQPFMLGGRLQKQADGSFVPNHYRDWRVAFRRLPDGRMELVVSEYGAITRRGIRRP
ncbi:MAG: serine hydrolase domain-containing protein [Vicinamibacterales bacterium]